MRTTDLLKYIDAPAAELLEVSKAKIILEDESTFMIMKVGGMIKNGQLAIISNAWADIVKDLPNRDSQFKQKFLDRVKLKEKDRLEKDSIYYTANFSEKAVTLTFFV